MVSFDRKDPLQRRLLRRVTRKLLDPPTHYVPSSHDFAHGVRAGLGWGMVPESWVGDELAAGRLVRAAASAHLVR